MSRSGICCERHRGDLSGRSRYVLRRRSGHVLRGRKRVDCSTSVKSRVKRRVTAGWRKLAWFDRSSRESCREGAWFMGRSPCSPLWCHNWHISRMGGLNKTLIYPTRPYYKRKHFKSSNANVLYIWVEKDNKNIQIENTIKIWYLENNFKE